MKKQFIENQIAGQPWVEPVQSALGAAANATVERLSPAFRNFLHGVWLGHSFHAAVTDVPIGALTTVTVLDLADSVTGRSKYADGADAALQLGLATATLAAVSGMADWNKSDQPARRVGAVHAACNGGATLLYLLSFILRRRGRRPAATGAGFLGWMLLGLGGYLGGHLVGHHRLGVDHAEREGPLAFTPLFPLSELPERTPHRAEVGDVGILLFKNGPEIFAIGEKCSHLGGPLVEGAFDGHSVTCPWHGSRFDLASGKVLEGPAVCRQPHYEVRVRDGHVEVRLQEKG